MTDETMAVAVSGNDAYVAAGSGGMIVMDISDPVNPRKVFGWLVSNHALDVAVSGQWAFLACGSAGLVVIDLPNPVEPQRLGGCSLPDDARGVAYNRGKVFTMGDRCETSRLVARAGLGTSHA